MLSKNASASQCRICTLHRLAMQNPNVDQLYAWMKNSLSSLGFVGFEAELYRFLEDLKT